ncbi:MAG TPA: ROK family protein [Candidatus Limnocylindrales bacterium]
MTGLPVDSQLTIGLDVGGTKTALVVTDAADGVRHTAVVPTDRAHLSAQLVDLARGAQLAFDAQPGQRVVAVGVAAPGRVDAAAGTVNSAVNLSPAALDVGSPIEAALGLPCFVEHDARAAAIWLAEQAPPDHPANLAYLSIGTGIAAGIVVDGSPLRGRNGLAGEVGHMVADPAGPQCACGLRGCLEALAAGPAIAQRASTTRLSEGHLPAEPTRPAGSASAVFDRAAAGDQAATRVVDETAGYLAAAVRGLVLAFGVDRVVIGGGVASAGDGLLGPLLRALDNERETSALVDAALSNTSIELLPPESAAGARGAALIARRGLNARQAVAAGGKGVSRG